MGYVNEAYLAKLEAEFAVSRKEKMLAHNMLQKVQDEISDVLEPQSQITAYPVSISSF